MTTEAINADYGLPIEPNDNSRRVRRGGARAQEYERRDGGEQIQQVVSEDRTTEVAVRMDLFGLDYRKTTSARRQQTTYLSQTSSEEKTREAAVEPAMPEPVAVEAESERANMLKRGYLLKARNPSNLDLLA